MRFPLLAYDDTPLWEEIWEYIQKYFTLDPGRYEHIQLGRGSLVTFMNIVIGLFIGVVIAAGMVCYDKNVLGSFVRKICKEECFSADRAKTLEELGFLKKGGVRRSLRSHTKLGKIIHCVEKETYVAEVEAAKQAYMEKNGSEEGFFMPEFKMDVDTCHFYIPDDDHYSAEVRYEAKGSGWRAFLLVLLVSGIAIAMICILMPEILQLIDNWIGIMKPNDGILN